MTVGAAAARASGSKEYGVYKINGDKETYIAGRTERSILLAMGASSERANELVDEALALAERIVQDADRGRVDLADLSRRARHLLESTAASSEPLF